MTYGLDTSFVLRLMTGEPGELALEAVRHLALLREAGADCFISDLVASETYYALQFHYKMPKEAALSALTVLGQGGDGIRFSGATGNVLQTPRLSRAMPGFVDRLIHADYRQAGHSMLTCEHAAGKLDNVRVVRVQGDL